MPPLTPAAIEMLWWLCFTTLSILFISGYVVRRITLRLHADHIRQLTDLHLYKNRLETLTSEMLSQSLTTWTRRSKYIQGNVSAEWSKNLGIACDELVQLGETLPLIDQLLERKKIKAAREGITRSCRMASKNLARAA